MTEKGLDLENIKFYWISEAEDSLKVADHLFDTKDYSYALFFGHLALEKMLKALYVKNQREHAPPIHSLQRLAKFAGLSLNEERIEQFILISSFNIEARYPDIKKSFREKCTKEYAIKQMQTIKEIYQWLKQMIG